MPDYGKNLGKYLHKAKPKDEDDMNATTTKMDRLREMKAKPKERGKVSRPPSTGVRRG
jgi:hypothetical protein